MSNDYNETIKNMINSAINSEADSVTITKDTGTYLLTIQIEKQDYD